MRKAKEISGPLMGRALRKLSKALVLLLMTGILFSCENEQGMREDLIRKEVDAKLAVFRKKQMQVCWENAEVRASVIVDSILIERARLEKDTLGKPSKPDKPEKPVLKTPLDSSKISPLFKDF